MKRELEVPLKSETDDSEFNGNENADNFTFINGYCQKLNRKPSDYVLVIFDLKTKYYMLPKLSLCH